MKLPGPDHPITIARNANRVRVIFAGKVIADTTRALTLHEASYPPVQYIPRADVDMSLLTPTAHASHCPYKGDASYFSIVRRRPHRRERGVELRAAVPGDGRDRRLSGVLSEPRGQDRGKSLR